MKRLGFLMALIFTVIFFHDGEYVRAQIADEQETSSKIAYICDQNDDGNMELCIVEFDEKNNKKIFLGTSTNYSVTSYSWSPSGKKIVYVLEGGDEEESIFSEIYLFDVESQISNTLVSNQESSGWVVDPTLSPDESKIAFISGVSDYGNLFVINIDDRTKTRFTNDCLINSFVWSNDGNKIAYVIDCEAYVIDIAG